MRKEIAIGILLGVVVILLFIHFGSSSVETFKPCDTCEDLGLPNNGLVIMNPYLWPYSGSSCVDDLYILNKDSGVDFGFNTGPLVHLTTPDHVELTN